MWSAQLNPRGLSQGDILQDVPVGSTKVPLTFLSKDPYPAKGGRLLYTKYDTLQPFQNDPGGHWLAKGRVCLAMVITHNCDLDDVQDTERVLVAPIAEASRISDATARQRILEGKRPTFIGLPGMPKYGDCYADLRSISPLDRQLFGTTNRHCSMTDDAVVLLRAQLVLYFTRIEPAALVGALTAGLAEENKT